MTAASTSTPDGHPASPPYVLVVDDEPDMLVNVARILRRGRYECVTAASGEEAMTLFQHRRPDLILTDLRMPGMDGLALLRAVMEHVPLDPRHHRHSLHLGGHLPGGARGRGERLPGEALHGRSAPGVGSRRARPQRARGARIA